MLIKISEADNDIIVNGVRFVPQPAILTDKTLAAALEVRFDSDIGNQRTVRDYLYQLLLTLWQEKDSFKGNRPFGNSGWEFDLIRPLVRHGFIKGRLGNKEQDPSGEYVNYNYDSKKAHAYVETLIEYAFYHLKDSQ
jgi:hypothetical protein